MAPYGAHTVGPGSRAGACPLLVAENGMAEADAPNAEGVVAHPRRIAFLDTGQRIPKASFAAYRDLITRARGR